jgi:spermidine/putrescine transport system permease protein
MITLPDLRPAMIAAGIVAFFVSFENFNTTLFLVGSEAPLAPTIIAYRIRDRIGACSLLESRPFLQARPR